MPSSMPPIMFWQCWRCRADPGRVRGRRREGRRASSSAWRRGTGRRRRPSSPPAPSTWGICATSLPPLTEAARCEMLLRASAGLLSGYHPPFFKQLSHRCCHVAAGRSQPVHSTSAQDAAVRFRGVDQLRPEDGCGSACAQRDSSTTLRSVAPTRGGKAGSPREAARQAPLNSGANAFAHAALVGGGRPGRFAVRLEPSACPPADLEFRLVAALRHPGGCQTTRMKGQWSSCDKIIHHLMSRHAVSCECLHLRNASHQLGVQVTRSLMYVPYFSPEMFLVIFSVADRFLSPPSQHSRAFGSVAEAASATCKLQTCLICTHSSEIDSATCVTCVCKYFWCHSL